MTVIRTNLDAVISATVRRLPTKKDVPKILQALGAAARADLISMASDELNTTARDYIQGLSKVEIRGNVATIKLVGVLPNMVEHGWPAHDLRMTVLLSPHAKTSSAGHRYLAVPFRHGAPGSTGRNTGPKMPKPIHNVAKHLAPTFTGVTRSGMAPMKLAGGRLHAGMPMSRSARRILETKSKPWHTGSIYQGMIRKVGQYGAGPGGGVVQQSSYQTWRTISEAVRRDPNHWKHPGIKARKLFPQAQKRVRKLAAQVVADASK